MTPEAQRIAIASVCRGVVGLSSSGAWMWASAPGVWHCCYPDDCPLVDMNAAMAAVRHLFGEDIGQDLQARHQVRVFIRELMKRTSGKYAPDWPDCDSYGYFSVLYLMLNLSPQDIFVAILRTLNLWTE